MATRIINGVERRLNWHRQPTDLNDIEIGHVQALVKHLPPSGTTRARAKPAIRDQKNLGSCTQNAGAAAMAFVYMLAGLADPLFSRLFGYWFTRHLEGSPPTEDSGCNVRDVFKAYRRWGLCLEETWPYDVSKFADEPSAEAKAEAIKHEALRYYACPTLHAIKQSIADGYPVIFGFDCFDSLESAETAHTGVIPLPKPHEGSIGGHCMMIDSYDDATGMFGGQNSWGESWGDGGYFRLPYDYFTRGLASDAWTLRAETP